MNRPLQAFAAVALSTLAGAPAALAHHHIFDYAVERFEADGNVHGPYDGTPDFVDEFDDGIFGPPTWASAGGTAVEEGGALHLRNPGLDLTILGLSPVSFDASDVSTSWTPAFVQAGAGDLVIRAFWRPQDLGLDHWLQMSLGYPGPGGLEFAGLALSNFTQTLGDLYSPPWPAGYNMTAHHDAIEVTGNILSLEHRAVDQQAITGPIVMELRYDDTAHTVTGAFSLDGGATYAPAFQPIPVTFLNGTAQVYLGADPRDGYIQCPGVLQLRRLTFGKLDGPQGDERLLLRADIGTYSLTQRGDGIHFVLTDEGTGNATIFDVTIPDRATAFQRSCDPRDGYFRDSYINVSDALPPDCTPGSAHGLRSVKMGISGRFKLKGRGATLPPITGPVKIGFYKAGSAMGECDGYVAHVACSVGHTGARCQ